MALTAVAQTDTGGTLSLQQCVEFAFKNNLDLKQSELNAQSARVDLKQSRNYLLPGVTGSVEHGLNQGRSIDPFSNTYLNQNLSYANYGLSTGILLFNGLSYQNAIKQQNLAY
jgi:outer membrane protein